MQSRKKGTRDVVYTFGAAGARCCAGVSGVILQPSYHHAPAPTAPPHAARLLPELHLEVVERKHLVVGAHVKIGKKKLESSASYFSFKR